MAKLENQISLKGIQIEQIVQKVNELTEIKKSLEIKHTEHVEDLKSKLSAKDSQLKNAKQVQDKLEQKNKEMVKDMEQSSKHAGTLENELIQQSEKYASLKKQS